MAGRNFDKTKGTEPMTDYTLCRKIPEGTVYYVDRKGIGHQFSFDPKEAAEFIKNVADFSGLSEHYGYNVSVGTNKSHLKWDNVIPLSVMKDYFAQDGVNRYIAIKEDVNLGRVVTDHYLYGKDEPTYYMQAGDDFYMIGDDNPLDLPDDIPTLSGTGAYKVRVSTRSRFYEVQAEIKINNMPGSEYSLKPGSDKKSPLRRE